MIGAFFAPLSARIFAGVSLALLIALGIMTGIAKMEHASAVKWETSSIRWQAAHDQLEANYRAAQAKAAAENKAHVEAVESTQSQITERVRNDYEARLAALRARYSSVHTGTATADRGAAGSTGVSGVPAPPAEPDAAAIACTSNTLQLEGLIEWVKEQEGVR
jgi:hypothetical protein